MLDCIFSLGLLPDLAELGNAGRSGKQGSMKLLVLGATGGIGLEILRQANERGHSVTAFVRAPQRLKTFGDRVAVIQGGR